MKQHPDRPRSGSRPPPRPDLGRFAAECAAGEPPRLPTPPSRAGGACALLFLPGGGRSGGGGGGEEVLGGLWEERLGGRPPKSPGSRSSWNMSTNSCCSSSKVSCTYGRNEPAGQRTRHGRGSRWRENILDAQRSSACLPLAWPGSSCRPSLRGSRPSPTAADHHRAQKTPSATEFPSRNKTDTEHGSSRNYVGVVVLAVVDADVVEEALVGVGEHCLDVRGYRT